MKNCNEQNIKKLTKKVCKFVKKSVSKSRYKHSVRTAKMCSRLCKRYGLNKDLGYFCGISHDMCKAFSEEELLNLAESDGLEISLLEREKPSLLHGRAAAVLLKRDFALADDRVIEAVQNHTFGKINMCDYAMVLYVADKIEPGREHITKEYLYKLFKYPLYEMVKIVLEENLNYLNKKNRKIAPETEDFYIWLKNNYK